MPGDHDVLLSERRNWGMERDAESSRVAGRALNFCHVCHDDDDGGAVTVGHKSHSLTCLVGVLFGLDVAFHVQRLGLARRGLFR